MKIRDFLPYNSFIIKMKKNVVVETRKKNLAGRHSELLCRTSKGQFKSIMELPLEKVLSKITCGALTISEHLSVTQFKVSITRNVVQYFLDCIAKIT